MEEIIMYPVFLSSFFSILFMVFMAYLAWEALELFRSLVVALTCTKSKEFLIERLIENMKTKNGVGKKNEIKV